MSDNKKTFWDQSLCMDNDADTKIDFNLKPLFLLLCRSWKKLLLWFIAAGIMGSIIAVGIPRQYRVVSKVAPELSLRSTSLTSLASLTGASMLSGNNDALLPYVYPDIVGSSSFLVDILNSPVNDSTLFYYLENDMPTFWLGKAIVFPMTVVGWIKNRFSDVSFEEDTAIDPYRLTKKQFSCCKFLEKSIDVAVDKKTFLVTISVTLPDKEVAAMVSRYVIDNLKKRVTEYRIQKAVFNAEYLEKVAAEAHETYMKSQFEYASYLDRNQSVSLKSNLVQSLDYQNIVNLNFQLYSSLSSELQQARTKVKQETPVFVEIVPPTVPIRSANSRKRVALLFALLGLVSASVHTIHKDSRNR